MTNPNIYIQNLDGVGRQVNWTELNHLKKDILWVFAENTNQLNAAFIPDHSFDKNYWEYLTMDGDKWFYEEDRNFYWEGVLIIILCMTITYIDTASGNQKIFGNTGLKIVLQYVDNFQPTSLDQKKLKDIVKLGLEIAICMTPKDLMNTDEYKHSSLTEFYGQVNWVDITFIKSYFKSLTV
jgi:hypothetical protein